MSRAIARNIGLSDDRARGLYVAGLVHDTDKIGVPPQILAKPSLGPQEYAPFKTHVHTGYNIMNAWTVRLSARPSGDAIILQARILIVADFVEAITS